MTCSSVHFCPSTEHWSEDHPRPNLRHPKDRRCARVKALEHSDDFWHLLKTQASSEDGPEYVLASFERREERPRMIQLQIAFKTERWKRATALSGWRMKRALAVIQSSVRHVACTWWSDAPAFLEEHDPAVGYAV